MNADANSLLPVQVRCSRPNFSLAPVVPTEAYHQVSKDAVKYALSRSCEYHLTIG